uniref:Uncharacterized protein n=1 Tax=Arsenophonus endosymbiont of Trialeurodes vaporariorum TaxID=235567 RepID=A0A3B0M928_9GAMM
MAFTFDKSFVWHRKSHVGAPDKLIIAEMRG